MEATETQSIKKPASPLEKVRSWGIWIVAFIIGRTAPGAVILPLLFYYGAHRLLKKFADTSKSELFVPISFFVAHSGWIIVALLMIQQLNASAVYALVGVVSAFLVYKRATTRIVYGVAVVNGLIGLDYLVELFGQQSAVGFAAFSVHVFLSAAGVITLLIAFRRRREEEIALAAVPLS